MRLLLLPLCLIALQDPPVDDIGPTFPDPLPSDRAWEAASAYFRKVTGLIRAGDFDRARAWERMARGKLPDPYRKHLQEKGRPFWPALRGLPGGRKEVDKAAALYIVALDGGEESEIPGIRLAMADTKGFNHEVYYNELAVAFTRMAEGRLDKALRLFDGIQEKHAEKWIPEQLDRYRAILEEIRAEPDSPEALAKTLEGALPGRERSWGPPLALMKRIDASLKSGAAGDGRVRLRQIAAHLLTSLGDGAGAAAWEDRLVKDPATPAGESRTVLAKRASAAFAQGDYKAAEELYRKILHLWPDTGAIETSFELGLALKMQARFGDARAVFEKIVATPEDPKEGRVLPGYGLPIRYRARFEIGVCFEGEGRWADALAAYLKLPDEPLPDGHGRTYRDFKISEAVLRCRVKAGRLEEALKQGRDLVDADGPCSPRIVVSYVDLAVVMGRFEAEEERLRSLPPQGKAAGVGMALDCIRVLKRRAERDLEGLFGLIQPDYPFHGVSHYRTWEDLRWQRCWLAVEAVESLAELGDDAIDYLVPIARVGAGRSYAALVVLARIPTEKARDLVKDLSWVEGHARQDSHEFQHKIAPGAPRERARLPEKKAPAADPRDAERLKLAAAKIRERLPELTGKVNGIDVLLARDTNAARLQALGDTLVAWKKGLIVDEDLQDLVTFGLGEKWSLDPKQLIALLRAYQAKVAGPLVEPALASEDAAIRADAAQLAGQFKLVKAETTLANLLQDKDREVFARALEALVALKARGQIPAIAAGLKVKGRAPAAISALGRLDSIEHAEEIAGFLEDSDPGCRGAAAKALADLGARKFAGRISILLQDKETWVRSVAAEALKRLEK